MRGARRNEASETRPLSDLHYFPLVYAFFPKKKKEANFKHGITNASVIRTKSLVMLKKRALYAFFRIFLYEDLIMPYGF